MLVPNLFISTKLTVLFILIFWFSCQDTRADLLPGLSPEIITTAEKLVSKDKSKPQDPCTVCRNLVRSFERGLRDTSRGKFEGGDADWEESRLGSYQDSEVRLVEIQEKLCDDLPSGKDQCHQLAEDSESVIENWWFKQKKQGVGLLSFLCVDEAHVCCEWNHYGPSCSPCEGHPGPFCSGHGDCNGNGTRRGTGKCVCHAAYTGDSCTECAEGYFVNPSDTVTCDPCDKSCLGHCRFSGPKGCEVCREGYIWDVDYGCLDVDECVEQGDNPCRGNTMCINTEGSFHCYNCDKACNGCTGDGPDMCKSCADDFVMKDGVCSDERASRQEQNLEMSRYATYLGLCLATCIIFRNNVYIASVIGLIVATYIGVAEYTVKQAPMFSPSLNPSFREVFADD